MRTAAWEIAVQIALRQLFQRGRKESVIYVILVKGEYMQSRIYFL